jgi:sulfite reductase alpha subunit-like flavoprotein
MELDPKLQQLIPPVYKVEVVADLEESKTVEKTLNNLPAPYGAMNKTVFVSTVVENERITSQTHFQDVRRIRMTTGPDFKYSAGDVLMIQCQNHPALVSAFLNRIGLERDACLMISPNQEALGQVSSSSLIKFPPVPISAFELFSFWLNLSEPPSRHFCGVMGHFLADAPGRQM